MIAIFYRLVGLSRTGRAIPGRHCYEVIRAHNAGAAAVKDKERSRPRPSRGRRNDLRTKSLQKDEELDDVERKT